MESLAVPKEIRIVNISSSLDNEEDIKPACSLSTKILLAILLLAHKSMSGYTYYYFQSSFFLISIFILIAIVTCSYEIFVNPARFMMNNSTPHKFNWHHFELATKLPRNLPNEQTSGEPTQTIRQQRHMIVDV